MSRRACWLSLLCAMLASAVVATSAQADFIRLEFWRNGADVTNSHQHIVYRNSFNRVTTDVWWRAGSGTGSQDGCELNHGWIPQGLGDLWGHYDHYEGSAIKGRVWYIADRACIYGTLRTELFIHSEETSNWGQSCTGGDAPFCWENWTDYYSNGCIKLSHGSTAPTDVADLNTRWDSADGRHGAFTAGAMLNVYGP